MYDAAVVGSGPNGLAAAIQLARSGSSVVLYEGQKTIGGGMRSAELTLPGFVHDVCSAIHPLGSSSPFFSSLPLADYGLEWIFPPLAVAHPLDDGGVAVLGSSVDVSGDVISRDRTAYRSLIEPLVRDWPKLAEAILGPLRVPHHPIVFARFGLYALRSARGLAEAVFKAEPARALLAGLAGHSILPLEKCPTAAVALVLAILAHAVGWPVARGGSQKIADALASHLRSLGGEIVLEKRIRSISELPTARVVLFDITPRQLLTIMGNQLPAGYRRKLQRFRHGPGVFKIDWALSSAIPWKAKACSQAGTVHIGGTLPEIALAERAVWKGEFPEKPYVLLAQPSLFDSSRAPHGRHTAWAYCHVPPGSNFDMTDRVEAQVERFAPGFRDCILQRSVKSPVELEQYNPNFIGGDITGGVQDLRQLFVRPVSLFAPYSTAAKNIFLCSSSTPPGGGVHGMCGYHAARAALRFLSK